MIYQGSRDLVEHSMDDYKGCSVAYNYLNGYLSNYCKMFNYNWGSKKGSYWRG